MSRPIRTQVRARRLQGRTVRKRRRLLLATGVLGLLSTSITSTTPIAAAGVPDDVELTPSGRLVITEPGTVIDSLEVRGSIHVRADNVRITNTRVIYSGHHSIRILPGVNGTVVEDSEILCGRPDQTNGLVFGNYTAVRVKADGCKNPFMYSASSPALILNSVGNGAEVNVAPDLNRPGQRVAGRSRSSDGLTPTPTGMASVSPSPTPADSPSPTAASSPTGSPSPTTTSSSPVRSAGSTPSASPTATSSPQPPWPAPASGSIDWPSAAGKQAVIDAAGLSNPSAVPDQPEGSLKVTEDGAVIENRHLNHIVVQAANVTIRNVKFTFYGSTWAIRANHDDVDNLLIENVELNLDAPDSCAGIWHGNNRVTMRRAEITGRNCDALKPGGGGSLYEGIYIHSMTRQGSSMHMDGFQPQGANGLTIRHSVVDMDHNAGANSAFIATPGGDDTPVRNVLIQEVWFSGGNYIVFANTNKANTACHQVTIDGIAFGRHHRHGPLYKDTGSFSNCGTVNRAIYEDTGQPIN